MGRNGTVPKLAPSSSSFSSASCTPNQPYPTSDYLPDINSQRYVYVLACLVGQTVTVKMKDRRQIRGIFHSGSFSSPSGSPDLSVILKCARELPIDDKLSSEIMDTLIIQAKDFISLSAENCATTFEETELQVNHNNAGFKTDVEISGNMAVEERELEKWEPESRDTLIYGSLEDRTRPTPTDWDQFDTHARRSQVQSTYREEIYTTPLDVTSIPQAVKDKANQIAREIEEAQYGTLDPEKLCEGDLDDDEEAKYGAVQGTGAFPYAPSGHRSATRTRRTFYSVSLTPAQSLQPGTTAEAQAASISGTVTTPQRTTGKEKRKLDLVLPTPNHPPSASTGGSKDVGQISNPNRSPMSRPTGFPSSTTGSRLWTPLLAKNISALNLEPAQTKVDDHVRTELLIKHPGAHGRSSGPGSRTAAASAAERKLLKQSFIASLNDITQKMEKFKRDGLRSTISMKKKARDAAVTGSSSASSKNFIFNPNADAFTPNTCYHCCSVHSSSTSTCSHKIRTDGECSKEGTRSVLPFRALASTPRHRIPIDQLLMSQILPALSTEIPSKVEPDWTVDPMVQGRCPFTYTQILGSLQQNSRVTAAVNIAAGNVSEEAKQSGSDNGTTFVDSRQNAVGSFCDYGNSRQTRHQSQFANTGQSGRPRQSSFTSTVGGSSPSTRQQPSQCNGSGRGQEPPPRSRQGSSSYGKVECEAGSSSMLVTTGDGTASPMLLSSTSTASSQQFLQQQHLLMTAHTPSSGRSWRTVRPGCGVGIQHDQQPYATSSTSTPLFDLNNTTTPAIYAMHPVMQCQSPANTSNPYPTTPGATALYQQQAQRPLVSAYQDPQVHQGPAQNGNYIVVTTSPLLPQGATGVVAFVNEDGTVQHTAVHAQTVHPSPHPPPPVVLPMEKQLHSTAGGSASGVSPQRPVVGGALRMGVNGSSKTTSTMSTHAYHVHSHSSNSSTSAAVVIPTSSSTSTPSNTSGGGPSSGLFPPGRQYLLAPSPGGMVYIPTPFVGASSGQLGSTVKLETGLTPFSNPHHPSNHHNNRGPEQPQQCTPRWSQQPLATHVDGSTLVNGTSPTMTLGIATQGLPDQQPPPQPFRSPSGASTTPASSYPHPSMLHGIPAQQLPIQSPIQQQQCYPVYTQHPQFASGSSNLSAPIPGMSAQPQHPCASYPSGYYSPSTSEQYGRPLRTVFQSQLPPSQPMNFHQSSQMPTMPSQSMVMMANRSIHENQQQRQ